VKADAELEPFARLVQALEPWLEQVVIIGGWAHRLYRLDARAQPLTYPPLTTLDSDVAVPAKIDAKEANIRERLLAAGFEEEFVGEDRPLATHYHLGAQGGFYAVRSGEARADRESRKLSGARDSDPRGTGPQRTRLKRFPEISRSCGKYLRTRSAPVCTRGGCGR
jgi:hypothetical protein